MLSQYILFCCRYLNMPKERRDRSLSFDRSRSSPYPCSSSSSRSRKTPSKNPLESDENSKEWEEARCPVCMEHPHNALLLLCSSHEKGCRPFMCDTSYRHSNCFDQFRKSFIEETPATEAEPPAQEPQEVQAQAQVQMDPMQEEILEETPMNVPEEMDGKLVCPLCRGQINGWTVVETARSFMNAKSRSCACENCDFSGSYTDLRKHARSVHPLERPSEADPERQRNWRRLEQQRDLGDLLSTLQSSIGDDMGGEESTLAFDEGSWLTVFFFIRVFRPGGGGSGSRSSSWSGASRARAQVTVRRRSTRLWGESYDGETESASRNDGGGGGGDDDESSDGGSVRRRRRRRLRRQPASDNES